MNIYKIEPDKLSKFMVRKALQSVGLLAAIILGFGLVLGLMTEMSVILVLFKAIWGGIFVFLLIIFFFSFLNSNIPASTRYIIADNFFARGIDSEGVNAFDQYTLNRLERKSGQRKFEKIYFNETKSIKFSDTKIVIKANEYNFMNGNGRIEIPCETEHFVAIKKRLTEICRSYRSIQRLF